MSIKPAFITLLLSTLALIIANTANAQTCNDSIKETTPNIQLIDNRDGTIIDNSTGLMWKQCSQGQSGSSCTGSADAYSWKEALEQAYTHTYAGYSDWRLPNIKELSSILERACYEPSINKARFPNTESNWYWSSSAYANFDYGAWGVNFYLGHSDANIRLGASMFG